MASSKPSKPRTKYRAIGKVSSFSSLKNGNESVICDSPIEKDLCFVLEFNLWVIQYLIHPFRITAPFSDGTHHSYTPDFQVFGTTGNLLIECKPASKQDSPHTRQQITIGEAWAEENNHTFLLITEEQLRAGHRLANIKLLHRYSRVTIPWSNTQHVVAVLSKEPAGLTFGVLADDLQANLTPNLMLPPRAVIFSLLFQHVLVTDMLSSITNTSILRLAIDEPVEIRHGAQPLL